MLRSRQIALGVLLLFASCCAALSQRPSPTERKTAQPEQQQPKAPQQPAATDERGTEQSPLIIKQLPTPKTQEEAEQARNEREAKAANDQEVIEFDRRLVTIGWLQLAVFVMQLGVFGYQAFELRKTVAAAAKQANLARDEFNATHRPKLRVRLIRLDRIDGPQIRIRYTVVNIGETLAILKRHEVMLYIRDADIQQGSLAECRELAGGESFICSVPVTFDRDLRWDFAVSGEIKVRGRIEYEDIRGITRRIGFFRTYDHRRGYFRKRDDTEDEEEYED
jgi:hypothetical protein